jgi:hypothetical protein
LIASAILYYCFPLSGLQAIITSLIASAIWFIIQKSFIG